MIFIQRLKNRLKKSFITRNEIRKPKIKSCILRDIKVEQAKLLLKPNDYLYICDDYGFKNNPSSSKFNGTITINEILKHYYDTSNSQEKSKKLFSTKLIHIANRKYMEFANSVNLYECLKFFITNNCTEIVFLSSFCDVFDTDLLSETCSLNSSAQIFGTLNIQHLLKLIYSRLA